MAENKNGKEIKVQDEENHAVEVEDTQNEVIENLNENLVGIDDEDINISFFDLD